MRTNGWKRRNLAPGLIAAAVIVGAMSWMPQAERVHAQANNVAPGRPADPAADVPDEYQPVQADLRMAHRLRTSAGRDAGAAAPNLVVHLDRRMHAGRWRTTLSLTGIEKPQVRTARGPSVLDNPFLITRLEYDDEGGAEPRLYDRLGRQVRLPGAAERRTLGVPAALRRTTWDQDVVAAKIPIMFGAGGAPSVTSGLVATSRRRPGRRQQIERRFGAPVDRLRGFDRFVATHGDTTEEVLVLPDANVPVEVNTVRGGVLVSRVQIDYQPTPAGDVVRKAMRIEQLVDGAAGTRLVTDVDVANLIIGAGGAQ